MTTDPSWLRLAFLISKKSTFLIKSLVFIKKPLPTNSNPSFELPNRLLSYKAMTLFISELYLNSDMALLNRPDYIGEWIA